MPDAPEPDVTALAREVERATRRVGELDARVGDVADQVGEHDLLIRQLAGGIADLAREVGGSDGSGDGAVGPQSWLLIEEPEEVAQELLDDLAEWVGAVYLWYPRVYLPACWMHHPSVVDELLWLRHTHAEAYRAGWSRVAEWHDRYRPGVVRRVGEALGDCDLDRHTSHGDRAARSITAPLSRHTAQIAAAWVSSHLPPEPTAAQIHDAEQYEAERGADR